MRSLTARAAAPVALVAALVLTLGACGDDYDSDLVDALKATGASQEEAECFIDEVGEDDAQRFVDLGDKEPSQDDVEKFLGAIEECGIDG